MRKIFVLGFILFSQMAEAYKAEIQYYIFEHKGKASDGSAVIEKNTEVTGLPAWFDWKCSGIKQEDGVLFNCKKGEDSVETKLYCELPDKDHHRMIRMMKGDHFITFEVACSGMKKVSAKPKVKPVTTSVSAPVSASEPTPAPSSPEAHP